MSETTVATESSIDHVQHHLRPTWDEYFLTITMMVSLRADCTRRQAGCVIVRNNRIVSTGYNGSPPGLPGCLSDGACPRGRHSYDEVPAFSEYSNCIALHAEQNAVAYASYDATAGGTAYLTDEPCDMCTKTLRAAGLLRVVYPDGELSFA